MIVDVQNYFLHCLFMQPCSFYRRTSCLSYALRSAPHGSIIFHYLPQQLISYLQFILINQFIHASPEEKLKQMPSFLFNSTISIAVINMLTKMGKRVELWHIMDAAASI
jgi:hypothetical protein